jgi:5-methylcytosine-specific restriction endonuclease McrA
MTANRDGIPLSFQRRVRLRAGNRCEYCGVLQAGQEATFHVDHVLPRRDGGPTTLENLALACVSCSLRKGARTEGRDPHTGEAAHLFRPRTQR